MPTARSSLLGVMGVLLSTRALAAEPPADPDPDRVAGFQDGFFLRHAKDWFRLYPRARLNVDFHSSLGPGASTLRATDGGTALGPRILVRRLRLELGGDFFKERVSFFGSVDFGTQPITNANGRAEQSAAPVGAAPTGTSARWAAVQTNGPAAAPQDVWVSVRAFSWLNAMVGQYQAPFGMENRTSDGLTPFMERNVAIRGFAFPTAKEIGVTAWGALEKDVFVYEIGAFGGDGQNRPQVDNQIDFVGRVYTRPLALLGGPLAKTQIGVSAHHGDRDQHLVGYDYPIITTGQGFALWDPTYTDSQGRLTHVMPAGAQNQVGGELRIPLGIAALQGEAYYVDNHTREAADGFQLTTTDRLGAVTGAAWYVQLSCWPVGDLYIQGDPGMTRPRTLKLNAPPERLKQGLELLVIAAGINARYQGASRAGVADKKTPSGDVTVYELGLGANYWVSRFFRASANYIFYDTPGSGSTANYAAVPGNLGKTPTAGAHVLHEISARLAVQL